MKCTSWMYLPKECGGVESSNIGEHFFSNFNTRYK